MLESIGYIVNIATDSCVTVLSLISSTLSLSFNLSFFIGQLIVKFGTAVLSLLIDCIVTLQTLVQVLTEDCIIFLSDIRYALSYLLKAVLDTGDLLLQGLSGICTTLEQGAEVVQNFIVFILLSVVNFVASVLSGIHYCLLLIKNSLVLVGLTSWDIFVFFPSSVVFIKRTLVSFIVQCMTNIRDGVNNLRFSISRGLKEIVVFVSDIPTESLYGLIVCISVGFICLKYHQSIRPLLVRNVLYILSQCQKTLITAWAYLESFTLWLLTNQMTPSLNETRHNAAAAHMPAGAGNRSDVDENDEDSSERGAANSTDGTDRSVRKMTVDQEERLCVVCQDKERCTIILPCRHVCLCYDCCGTIKRTQGRCPICRNAVRRTMRVFI